MIDVVFEHPGGKVTRVRKVSPVQSRRGAEEYERQVRGELLAGTYGVTETTTPVRSIPTLSEFATGHLANWVNVHNKQSTADAVRSILGRSVLPELGHLPLTAVIPALENYMAKLIGEGFARSTVRSHLAVISRMLHRAYEQGLLERAPRVKFVKVPRVERLDFLNVQETLDLCSVEHPLVTMATVAVRTGLRRGELLALRWANVGPHSLWVRERKWKEQFGSPKSNKVREVPLSGRAQEALDIQRARTGRETFVWGGAASLPYHSVVEPLEVMCAVAGIRTIGWHTLRHTFASHLVMRGVPLTAVMQLMGHHSMDETMRYAHLAPGFVGSAVRVLDSDD